MNNVLDYKAPLDSVRLSRQAVVAVGIAVLGPVLLMGAAAVARFLPEALAVVFVLGAFFIPPGVAFFTGLAAIVRTSSSQGQLRGQIPAWLGVLIAVGWPLFFIFYVLNHLNICC